MTIYDSIVIGAGPAGITAALYLVRSGCTVALVEQMTPGGQVLQTESIENYPGFPKGIKGWELADTFAAHLDELELDKFTGGVVTLTSADGVHSLSLDSGQTITGRTVIVCSGARHKPLGLADEKRLTGHGVSYCAVCDGNFFRGQEVAVVGGGNTALEESLYLAKIAAKVYLIHRRDAFRGAKVYQDRIASMPEKIVLITNTVVDNLQGEGDLTGLTLRDVTTNATRVLPVAGLFVFVGYEPATGFLPPTVEKNKQGFVLTDAEMRTSLAGVFAAGDVRDKMCRQVVTAVGDGATAAQAAFVYLEQLHA